MEGNEQLSVIIPMLKAIAGHIDDAQLTRATPCANFDVAGVLGHMTGLASGFAPMFRGEDPPPAGPESAGTGATATDRFQQAMDELLAAVMSPGALERTIQTPLGPMPGAMFSRLVAFDGLVHGWDLASSTGQEWQPSEQLVTEVDAFARSAITNEMRNDAGDGFGPELRAPSDATALLRLIAFTGRSV